ncbi:histidine phosphatase family protein [Luteococcus peritonei]|uniref:Histidine phosphatase family protein n=1 Tax=Luteococcus peritonei TaxID=88874 RepID=A0ABW4RUW0_9ACTN
MDLLLVRHGQSTWNLERRLQGQTMDVPLTALGQQQARQAADEVARLVPQGTPVLTSDQLRARQSAALLAARLGSRMVETPLLREQGLGRLEGLGLDELVAEPTPPGRHVTEVAWGGGESIEQVHHRCRNLLALLAREHAAADALVLVSHGDLIRCLLNVLDGRGHREMEWPAVANGQVLRRTWGAAG